MFARNAALWAPRIVVCDCPCLAVGHRSLLQRRSHLHMCVSVCSLWLSGCPCRFSCPVPPVRVRPLFVSCVPNVPRPTSLKGWGDKCWTRWLRVTLGALESVCAMCSVTYHHSCLSCNAGLPSRLQLSLSRGPPANHGRQKYEMVVRYDLPSCESKNHLQCWQVYPTVLILIHGLDVRGSPLHVWTQD